MPKTVETKNATHSYPICVNWTVRNGRTGGGGMVMIRHPFLYDRKM